jgi:FG-GAP repeat.
MGKCLSILLNNGAGGFTAAPTVATGNNPYAVTLGDLDGDGDLDIATTNSGGVPSVYSATTALVGSHRRTAHPSRSESRRAAS